MKIIKNALEIASQIENRGRARSEQSKTLLKLKVGEGFTTNSKKKIPSLRVLAARKGMKISALAAGNGAYLVCRVK